MANRRHATNLPTPPSYASASHSVPTSLEDDAFGSSPDFELDDAYENDGVIDPRANATTTHPVNRIQSVDGVRQDASRSTAPGAPTSVKQLPGATARATRRSSSAKQNQARPSTGQAAITQQRGDSVTEQFGMITPPDGVSVHSADVDASKSRQYEAKQASDKSESARRAANKRHAKEKSRKAEVEVVYDGQIEDEEKKEQYREKNKIAAAKCRNKKRRYNDEIETQARQLETRNKALKAELMDLRNVVILLKDQILKHSPQDCGCTRLHEYSMGQAAKMLQNSHRASEELVATHFSTTANPSAKHLPATNGPSPVEVPQGGGRMWGSLSDHMASVTMGSDMSTIMASSEMQRRATFPHQYDGGFQPQFVAGDDLHSGPSSVVSPVGMPGFVHSGEFVSPGMNTDMFRGNPFEEPWEFMQ